MSLLLNERKLKFYFMKLKLNALFTAFTVMAAMISVMATPFSAETETTEKLRVMPLGDSITDGFSTVGGYRTSLCNLLKDNGYSENVDFVGPNWGGDGYDPQHAGYSGYSIDNIPQESSISGQRTGISSFIDWLMTEYPADVVMMQIGTNDILSYYDLDNIGTRLESLVDTVLTYIPDNGMLYLATIPYMDASNTLYISSTYFTVESMDECVDAYNLAIREIAAEKAAEGKNIRLADVNGVLTKSDLYDGVHPTADGYAKMGSFWYEKLEAFINSSSESTSEPTTSTSEIKTDYTVADLVMLSRHLIGISPLSSEYGKLYDINNDGIIDGFDFIAMRKLIVSAE